MSVDQSFKDLVGDTEQGDGTIALWVLYRFLWLWDCKRLLAQIKDKWNKVIINFFCQ